ncbi:hypothetical protein K9N68_37930 (plasmid) [Kovacikia minuta CCNUW1]|uniref:hypothetical protein n=1 Tax=Kovacikia minuta TaxID=2931930 RepID=UPI001CCBCB7C|nr:hypothetical protein [Kovacikia minuta]UBF29986.1 hypothetical protein K9N68_37930 [Kovacikia minuta CCNUW1]
MSGQGSPPEPYEMLRIDLDRLPLSADSDSAHACPISGKSPPYRGWGISSTGVLTPLAIAWRLMGDP